MTRIIPKVRIEAQEIRDSGYHPPCVINTKGGKNGKVSLIWKERKGKRGKRQAILGYIGNFKRAHRTKASLFQ